MEEMLQTVAYFPTIHCGMIKAINDRTLSQPNQTLWNDKGHKFWRKCYHKAVIHSHVAELIIDMFFGPTVTFCGR